MTGQTRVTNTQAVTHKSWLVRFFPCAPGFSQFSDPPFYMNLPFIDISILSDPAFIKTFPILFGTGEYLDTFHAVVFFR